MPIATTVGHKSGGSGSGSGVLPASSESDAMSQTVSHRKSAAEEAHAGSQSVAYDSSTLALADSSGDEMFWVVNTVASHHILNDVRFAKGFHNSNKSVIVSGGQTVKAQGTCSVDVITKVGSKEVHLTL